jgi:hypothetical protein
LVTAKDAESVKATDVVKELVTDAVKGLVSALDADSVAESAWSAQVLASSGSASVLPASLWPESASTALVPCLAPSGQATVVSLLFWDRGGHCFQNCVAHGEVKRLCVSPAPGFE